MSYFLDEYVTQPACWLEAAKLASASVKLPKYGADVVFLGCGTSYYMGLAAARYREKGGGGLSDAYSASDLPVERRYDNLVIISRSGRTLEVLQAVQASKHGHKLALTADEASPLVDLVDEVIALPFASERSLVQTRFATSALGLLLAAFGWDMSRSSEEAARLLGQQDAPEIGTATQLVFLGSGMAEALAYEAALKLRELFGLWTEAYSISEFRHGPMAAIGDHSLVWLMGVVDSSIEQQVVNSGARVLRGSRDPLVELVRVHAGAARRVTEQGIDPEALVTRARRFKGML